MTKIKHAGWGKGVGRKAAMAVGAVCIIWGGLWLGMPRVVAQQIQDKASEALGRTVTVRGVDVSPWALAVTVHGLEVAGLQGRAPALSIERTYINASLTSLLRWAPVLDAVEMDQPVVRVSQEADGKWDFADVLEKLQQDSHPDDPAAGPTRMALYNIQIRDGRFELNDKATGVLHTIEALQLQLPFISTLSSQREVKVLPQLSMRLNGSEIASQAVSTPFDATQSTQAKLEIKQFDLATYVPYLPEYLPIRLQEGELDASLLVNFEQKDQPTVQLQGSTLQLSNLKLQDRDKQPLAGWGQVQVELGDTRPLQQQVRVTNVTLKQPFVHVHRRADGVLLPMAPEAASARQGSGAALAAESSAASPEWKLWVDRFNVEGGWANWRDDLGQAGASLRMDHLQLHAQDLKWPMGTDAQWQLSAQLQSEDRTSRGSVRSTGKGGLESGHATLIVDKLDAQALQAYAKQWLKLPVGGLASLTAGIAWKQGRLHAKVPSLAIESVSLGQTKIPEVAWTGLQLRNLELDTRDQQVQVEHIALNAPTARVQRNAQGRWMYEQWLQPVVGAPAKGKETVASPAGKPWQVLVQDMELAAGQVELTDASLGSMPLAIKLTDVQLRMQNVDSIKGTAQTKLSARMAERTRRGGWGKPGGLSYEGSLQLDPLLTKGRVQLNALPLQAFEPYMAPYMNVRLVRALASFDGNVQYAQRPKGPQLQLQGQGRVTDVHVQTVAGDEKASQAVQGPHASPTLGAEDLLRWKQLRLQGVQLNMQPAQPPHVQVRSTELQDFYARVVVLPEGRLNLQNLVKSDAPAEDEGSAELGKPSEEVLKVEAAPAEPSARIDMGPIALHGGVIKFSDYFIQPNYTADLTALNGSLEAFSSHPVAPGEAPALAKLTLEGVAQGTARLNVDGVINPLAQPLALDVRAQVQGLDLSPLTPYSIKYAGHGIEKGKLSMDVRYEVQPDGQLTASNQLVLNQLTFSEPVEGAPASLPVRLAVALLADSNGVIDLNLPISGSLNDPQFRIAPVVFKIIGNIIRKAVTAPFSLLTGAFASDDESSGINFAPGQSRLDKQAQTNLQQLAKAMNDKPQLKLTLVGQADHVAEEQGWKQAQLERRVQGTDATEDGDADKPVRSEKQKLAALKRVYRETVKDLPRNMLGLSKDLAREEMEALILQNMVIPATAWHDLASERAQNVRDYLLVQGVDPKRVFLGAVGAKAAGEPSPSVLLNISVQ
ncbi:DUF748 domain-containing protein [Comamonas sp. NoAH]|uniref:DUF748 domain-containing protein n=1 Tax=Comamonas halotolerans TaxID=3041496 RepID=UPI0024E06B82|nr:DUF748 domain-containing protein [Comamonas sp. NoAH]